MTTYTGTSGNDTFGGTSAADFYNLAAGGNDTANGGAGNDVFSMGGALTAVDRLVGGAGYDSVILNGNYAGGVTFNAATLSGIEEIDLFAGNSYKLTLNDANLLSGEKLVVNAAGLAAGNALDLDASLDKDGRFDITGGAGNDAIRVRTGGMIVDGGAGNDTITLTEKHFGDDTVSGGSGDDTINLGLAFDSSDRIDGGAGKDVVQLNGDYNLTLAATTMTGIETLKLTNGHDYAFSTADGNVAAGDLLYVDASTLGTASHLTWRGGAETDGSFRVDGGAGGDYIEGGDRSDVLSGNAGNDTIRAGAGDDQIKGGAGDDVIYMGGNFTGADTIDGGTGANIVYLGGDYAQRSALSATSLVNIQTLKIDAPGSVNITFHDGNVTGANQLTVSDGGKMVATNTLTLSAASETTGSYYFDIAGPEKLALAGGGGNDTFSLRSGQSFKAGDRIDGGGGYDRIELTGDYSAGLVLGATMTNVEQLRMNDDFSYKLTFNDANIAAGQLLTVSDKAQTAGRTITLNGAAETDGQFYFQLDSAATVDVTGGAGNDGLVRKGAMTAADHFDGGAGVDYLSLAGDYAGLTLGANTLVNVEGIALAGGHSYRIATHDANVAAGATMAIAGAALGVSDHLTFDGSAEKDGTFIIDGGAGDDTLIGGAGADTIAASSGMDMIDGKAGDDIINLGGDFDNVDKIDGGAGNDVVNLSGDYSAGVAFNAKTLVNVEQLNLSGGYFELATHDATVATNRTLTVDASGATHLAFDGSFELDGAFIINGSTGSDTITGGAKNDLLSGLGGSDFLSGGGGNDTFLFVANQIDAGDMVSGGDGVDTVRIRGALPGTLALAGNILGDVERLSFDAFYDYKVATGDDAVGAGKMLTVDGSALTATDTLAFDGSAETDGRFTLTGGAGNDVLTGGAGIDKITGGLGKDVLTGGAGKDVFVYTALAESGLANADTIKDFVRGTDKIDVHLLDANIGTAGDDAFHFGATAGHVGDITAAFDAANDRTIVNFFVDGDAVADFRLILSGDQHLIGAGDFLL